MCISSAYRVEIPIPLCDDDGDVWTFGWGYHGRLGHGLDSTEENLSTPTLVDPLLEETLSTPTVVEALQDAHVHADPGFRRRTSQKE